MYHTIKRETIEALKRIDTPSVCNAIEGFNVKPKNEGFMLPETLVLRLIVGPG